VYQVLAVCYPYTVSVVGAFQSCVSAVDPLGEKYSGFGVGFGDESDSLYADEVVCFSKSEPKTMITECDVHDVVHAFEVCDPCVQYSVGFVLFEFRVAAWL